MGINRHFIKMSAKLQRIAASRGAGCGIPQNPLLLGTVGRGIFPPLQEPLGAPDGRQRIPALISEMRSSEPHPLKDTDLKKKKKTISPTITVRGRGGCILVRAV